MAGCNAVVVATGARDPLDVSPPPPHACIPDRSPSSHPRPTHSRPTHPHPINPPAPNSPPPHPKNKQPLGPLNVDFNGTLNLIEAARRAGVTRFVLVTSIGCDELLNPLNFFFGVLVLKKQAELALARSGLEFTVVRPGGLKSELRSGEAAGEVVMKGAGTYGFPPMRKSGSILRSQVGGSGRLGAAGLAGSWRS
jgi:hypothetical protein